MSTTTDPIVELPIVTRLELNPTVWVIVGVDEASNVEIMGYKPTDEEAYLWVEREAQKPERRYWSFWVEECDEINDVET
jgi:hypothetical protein